MPKQVIVALGAFLVLTFPLFLMAKTTNLQSMSIASIKHTNDVQWLERQIVVAEISFRDDIVTSATERLLAIDPNNHQALSALGRLYQRQNKNQLAQIILQRLEKDKTAQQAYFDLKQYLALKNEKKAQYNRAKLLIKGGQTEQAIEAYNALFLGRFSTLTYRLEYLNLLANEDKNWQVIDTELSEYLTLYPRVPVLELEYANHLRRRDPQNKEAILIFRRLAGDPKLGLQASDLWLRSLQQHPMSEEWVTDHATIASFHPNTLSYQVTYQRAKDAWNKEKKLRTDPTYLAKLDGIRMIDNNQSSQQTLQKLNYAYSTRPNDIDINSALGQYWLRNKAYLKAIKYFKKAQQLDSNPNHQNFYRASLETANYWQHIKFADNAIEHNEMQVAKEHYFQAINITPDEAYAYVELAKLSQAQLMIEKAKHYLQQALTKEPFSKYALETGLNIHLTDNGIESALLYVNSLSEEQKKIIAPKIERLQQHLKIKKLQIALKESDTAQIDLLVNQLVKSNNNDPWATKKISDEMQSIGLTVQADKLMDAGYQTNKSTEMQYAYALYLTSFHGPAPAKKVIGKIPKKQWDTSIKHLDKRLDRLIMQQKLTQLISTDPKQANLYLQQKSKNPTHTLFVVEGYIQLGENTTAHKVLIASDPSLIKKEDWPEHIRLAGEFKDKMRLAVIEKHIKTQSTLDQKSVLLYKIKIEKQRITAYELLKKGNIEQARLAYFKIINNNESVEIDELLMLKEHGSENVNWEYRYLMQQRKNMSDSQLLRLFSLTQRLQQSHDAGQVLEQIDRQDTDSYYFWLTHDIAEQYGNTAVSKKFAFKTLQRDALLSQNKSLSEKESYLQARDFWMTNSARTSIDAENKKKQSYLEIGFHSSLETSDSHHTSIPLSAKIAMPEWGGHLLFRSDIVSTTNEGLSVLDSTQSIDASATGMSFAIGWETDTWRADIGTTPINFEYQQWVGGLLYNINYSNFSFKLNLSQRPETGSSIAYSGISDNISDNNEQWGGVIKTGASLSMSWDSGSPIGFWSAAEFHQLTGNNVKDNQRVALMAGSYYKLKVQDHQRLNIGLSFFSMAYDNNQNVIAPGYGDYYSPQSYLSMSIPVSYYTQISQDWTVGLLGSVSHSWSKIEAPLNSTGENENSSGFGVSLEAITEYKLSSHWSAGGYLGIKASSDYQPNQIKLYLRYYFNENWGTTDLIPSPVELYSSF